MQASSCWYRVWTTVETTLLLPLAWTLRVAANNLDLIGDHGLPAVLHLELDVLDQKSPDLVAESVGVERALCMGRRLRVSLAMLSPLPPCLPGPWGSRGRSWAFASQQAVPTLNVRRAFTFSCSTSAIARSKLARIFIANWGSMRVSVMRSSRVSVRVAPMLFSARRMSVSNRDVGLAECGAAQCTCYGGKARSIAARWTPSCLVVPWVPFGVVVVDD